MQPRSIDDVLTEARRGLDRVTAGGLGAELAAGAVVVDIRPVDQRQRDGELPGATVVGRNELEWRLDPQSPYRLVEVADYDRRIIVVCNEGYASSLAAASLRQLGLRRATDLDGGFQAWKAATDVSRVQQVTAHWERTYGLATAPEPSWFEEQPVASLHVLAAARADRATAIIDVGGGGSRLVDELLARGHRDVTVLDVSSTALQLTRGRLGADAQKVRWIVHDLLTWSPARRYGLWHDRAVFHFLVTPAQRAAYLAVLHAALGPSGTVAIGTFAEDGPEQCSGLPTARYTPAGLTAELGAGFDVVAQWRHEHVTPAGVVQPFTWLVLRSRT